MTTKVIFNIDTDLKNLAMRKARKDGMSLSAFLNIATRAYTNNTLVISAFDRDIAVAREQVRQGKTFSAEAVYKRFNIKM